jgi:hypothetical protein
MMTSRQRQLWLREKYVTILYPETGIFNIEFCSSLVSPAEAPILTCATKVEPDLSLCLRLPFW